MGTHTKDCMAYEQQPNDRNGGLVQDTSWPCTCGADPNYRHGYAPPPIERPAPTGEAEKE